MTKDGRPSLINDIRLFAGDRYSYLGGHQDAVAFARRMALYLNGEGFSLGAFPALYVFFNLSLESGLVRATNEGGDWWHRYVHVGVDPDFPNIPGALEVAMCGIVEALAAIRPDQVDTIRRADTMVREYREDLRFLLKRRETKKRMVEISFNIEAWPTPSQLFICHTDKTTGIYSEADPIALGWHFEGFDLASSIRLQDATNLKVKPHRPAMSAQVRRRG